MNEESAFKVAEPYKHWWIRDHADAREILEDIIVDAMNIAEGRRSQDDEYKDEDADSLERLADLALLVQEYLEEK